MYRYLFIAALGFLGGYASGHFDGLNTGLAMAPLFNPIAAF
ncbi:hypothetical protein [Pseudomonas sp. UBA6310]|nr:hypothetical protein [Pseudomonas sp. UBA6310]